MSEVDTSCQESKEVAVAEAAAEKKEVISSEDQQTVPVSAEDVSLTADNIEMPEKISELSPKKQEQFMASRRHGACR